MRPVQWPGVRSPIGIAGYKSPVIQLDGVAETSTRAAADGCSGVNHEDVVLEIKFKAVFGSRPSTARTPRGGSIER